MNITNIEHIDDAIYKHLHKSYMKDVIRELPIYLSSELTDTRFHKQVLKQFTYELNKDIRKKSNELTQLKQQHINDITQLKLQHINDITQLKLQHINEYHTPLNTIKHSFSNIVYYIGLTIQMLLLCFIGLFVYSFCIVLIK
jgi:hypothetical protein